MFPQMLQLIMQMQMQSAMVQVMIPALTQSINSTTVTTKPQTVVDGSSYDTPIKIPAGTILGSLPIKLGSRVLGSDSRWYLGV